MENTKLSAEETMSQLEMRHREALHELEHELLPKLGNSQKRRLILAAMQYPIHDELISVKNADDIDLVKAYSACKAISDILVALGVETVLQQFTITETPNEEKING